MDNNLRKFYTTEQISPRQEKTPEGYLLCHDVTISRLGSFDYTASEVGLKNVPPTQTVKVERIESELFRPETIKSFEGKPITIGHDIFVDPTTWKEATIGTVQNVRRGDGDQSDQLLADLLVTDARGIQLIESQALREVSCGFYSDVHIDDDTSRVIQVGILGNHVALVKKARCGAECQIKDGFMTETKPTGFKAMLRRLFKDGDQDKFNDALDDLEITHKDEEKATGDEDTTAPAPSLEERFTALEKQHGELLAQLAKLQATVEKLSAPQGTGDEDEQEKPTADSDDEENVPTKDEGEDATAQQQATAERAQEIIEIARELAPDVKVPQGDSANGLSTKALNQLMRTAIKRSGIKTFADADSLKGESLSVAFRGALAVKRAKNNPKAKFGDSSIETTKAKSNEDLNAMFKKFWNKE